MLTHLQNCRRKLRMIIMPAHRKDIKIERIMPAAAGKLFMDKRMKHMRNVKEEMQVLMNAEETQHQIKLL